jgi:hypothetical protein
MITTTKPSGEPSEAQLKVVVLSADNNRWTTRRSPAAHHGGHMAVASMDDEVELFSDDDGLAVTGTATAVERFIESIGLSTVVSTSLGRAVSVGASAAQTGSDIAANAGRWVKLTEESALKVKKIGWTPTKTPGVSHAMLGKRGDIKNWVQIVTSPGAMVTNPAVLSGVAGLMSQRAMQQQMDEIVDYLATIDAKLDQVIRSQMNQVLARLDGVNLSVREAMSVRQAVGRVSEVTWSKVQTSAQAIHETQGYALRQLSDLADRVEEKKSIADLVDVAHDVKAEVQKWLVVLARCFELHDAVAVLELDRVLDGSPDEVDKHRLGLKSSRQDRLNLISERTEYLLGRMNAAVAKANSKVLFNPKQSPAVVESSNSVAADVLDFHDLLGIESGRESSEAKRWIEAAGERWDKARETSAQGVDGLKRFGGEARLQAGSMRHKLTDKLAERKQARRKDDN